MTDQNAFDAPPESIIETDYEVGQDNIVARFGPFPVDMHNPVFPISAGVIVLFVILTLAFQSVTEPLFTGLRDGLTGALDWFFILTANLFLLFCLGLVLSPWASVRLGGPDARPDYGYPAWFAMLFSAGMGIGLMYYGVGEPMAHFSAAVAADAGGADSWAPLAGAPGDPEAAMRLGLAASIHHWGLHAWAIYAVVALALALFSYNKGLPLTIRSAFHPLLGERVWGWPGHLIDILAVFATLFGLATSLGIGAEQVNAGLGLLFGAPVSLLATAIIVLVITAVATASVVAGLDGGVKRLSEANMTLAALLFLFVILAGPTLALLSGVLDGALAYAGHLPALSNPFGREDANFAAGWSAFYWAWWISWSPFVGMFIARVSRGRTVREFIVCVLLIPSFVCLAWFAVFGGAAIDQVVAQGREAVAATDLELQLFALLDGLPFAAITSAVAIVLVVVFFVTSADSGSLVIDTITAGGKVDAPLPQRIFWCVFGGLVAIALLLGGGLAGLQAMTVS
ncbi:MAG: BCCT family transporter, partial [Rubrimonas sp.]